jgi:hypothetical protein
MADEIVGSLTTEQESDSDSVQSIVTRLLEDASDFFNSQLEPDLQDATQYYWGREFGDEKDGRSKVVSTDVRDATMGQLPQLMEIFAGSERVVEFTPRGPEDVAQAEQETDYVNFTFLQENNGFIALHSAFKDALVRRMGIIKWWWEEDPTIHVERYTGLTEQDVQALMMNEAVEDLEVTGVQETPFGIIIDAEVAYVPYGAGHVRVEAVPNEEFLYSKDARSLDDAAVIAHTKETTVDELVNVMGLDRDLVEANVGRSSEEGPTATYSESLRQSRQFHGGEASVTEQHLPPSQRPVLYTEAYIRMDADGDGVGELRMFQCVGDKYEIANGKGDIVDEIPFAIFVPEPEPHTISGLSNFDVLGDIQRIKSQIQRHTLNSLAQAIEPQMEVVSPEVNISDLINPEISGIVRVRRPGMLREIRHEFVGAQSMPILSYYDEVRADRTGHTRASEGLDPDSLQSSTEVAVNATLTAAQQRIKYVARVFAETGMKRLFKGLRRTLIQHQNQQKIVRLRGTFVNVDPATWEADRDVMVNVGLGTGSSRDRMAALAQIVAKQSELMAQGSPLVSNVEIRNALAAITEMSGWKDTTKFWRPWGPQEEQEAQQQAQQNPPPPPPEQQLIDLEKQKNEIEAQMEMQKLQLEQSKLVMEDDFRRDKLAQDVVLKELEVGTKMVDIQARTATARRSQDNGGGA